MAWHFVHYSECLNLRISSNHNKGLRFSQSGNSYFPYGYSSLESLLYKVYKIIMIHLSFPNNFRRAIKLFIFPIL